jgi:hypothetical protein
MGLIGKIGSTLGEAAGDAIGSWLGFANGGRVPGKVGAPKKAVVHGGEVVLPVGVKPTAAQKKAIRARGGKV